MAIRSAENMRQKLIDYAQNIKDRDLYAIAVSKKITEPVFSGFDFHPDEEPDKVKLEQAINLIGTDAITLDSECQGQADDYANLIASTTARLKNIRSKIANAGQKADDINILCGSYPEFTNILDINSSNLTGDYYDCGQGTFCAARDVLSSSLINYTVKDVTGNGYEGNAYVVSGNSFLSETNSTSSRKLMTDSILETAYEYSRILSDNTNSEYSFAQKDGQQAACTIEVTAEKPFNIVIAYSDTPLVLNNIARYDGMQYEWQNRPTQKMLEQPAFASVCASMPQTTQAKIAFSQTTTNSDIIGIETSNGIKTLPDAKRSAIRICAIDLIAAEFYKTSVSKTAELLKTPVDSVSIMASEYVPSGSIKYILTINGKDYTVQPMNSQKTGTKIIRYSTETAEDDYVTTISEKISSAYLTVCINTASTQETPFLSKLRVCIGGSPK